MDTEITSENQPQQDAGKHRVKIFGIGSAGVAMIEQMAKEEFSAAKFAAINTDASATTGIGEQIHLETKLLRGLGTGGDPERGRKLAEEHFERLKESCAGADVVFIVAGLGGGAGTGVSPVLAKAARESGALVLAFVSLPFECEGNRRQQQAQHGLDQLKLVADGVVCLPNQKAFKLIDEHASLLDTFRFTSNLLIDAVRGVWRLLMYRGLIEIHFDELCALLRERHGESCFATVESAGTTRARDAIEKLPAHPLLDGGKALEEAGTVIVSIMGGPELSMADVNRVMQDVNGHCKKARVIMGAAVSENFRDRLAVTVIVMRRANPAPKSAHTDEQTDLQQTAAEFETELMHPTKPERPVSRVVPPAPALTVEQREEILTKHTGRKASARKSGPRMRQTTLPLDIVNKGRFDKSEPTIYKGEDLDLPTYVRRGVSLN